MDEHHRLFYQEYEIDVLLQLRYKLSTITQLRQSIFIDLLG